MTRTKHSKIWKIAGITLGILGVLYYLLFSFPFRGQPFNGQRHGNPPVTPAWALECWLWEDDVNRAQRVDELLEGYARHDIPVRTILLDSPWSTRYNDFQVDENLYPKPEAWFNKLQEKGYRVVLWMTPMVNSFSDDTGIKESESWYNTARDNNLLAGKGHQINWWKGKGGFIDYTNPEALTWWHGLQQKVFDYGIDGWKMDGSATLFSSKIGPVPLPYMRTFKGLTTTRKYMDLYYRQEYLHGVEQNPEFITLSRSMDRGFHPEGFAPIDASTVNWVGDQEHHWKAGSHSEGTESQQKDIALKGIEGFESAIESILKSAKLGYSIIGSDVAGFSGGEIPPRLYIRWAQFSTFCGLFLNGGHGERALWNRSEQELKIIREYSWLHTELVPYIYSSVVEAHNGGKVLQRPMKGKYHYMFGDHLLIAPIYMDDLKQRVRLPAGKWRYWFDDKEIIEGPVTFEKEFPLEEYPVFIREGAIIPMNIERAYTRIGDENSTGYLTLRIYPDGNNAYTVRHSDSGKSTTISVEETRSSINIAFQGSKMPHILNLQLYRIPQKVLLDNQLLAYAEDYHFDAEQNKLIIKTNKYTNGKYIIVKQ
ncbi:MAG: TIM-barrel domain-containing protein [Bacteroidota bacterium]